MKTRLLRRASAGALALTLIGSTAAFADDIYNDLDGVVDTDLEVMSLTMGGQDGSTILAVQPQGGDGKSGCNLTGSTTLVVNVQSSNPDVATVSPSSLTFDSCGAERVVTVTQVAAGTANVTLSQVSNNSGGTFNLAPAAFRVDVASAAPTDSTPPVIGYTLNPAAPDGDSDWYKGDVTLTWTVTENESPSSLVKTGCDNQSITADQQETTYSCSASSLGGQAQQVDVKIKRDGTAPEVSLVGGPAQGASYYFGSVPASPTCNASDATSGLDDPCSVSGYSQAVGTHTVTATASDNAGNEGSSDQLTYTVLAWTLSGFYAPVDMNGVWNTVKGGSTVPLKFELFAGAAELTDTSAIKSFTATPVICGTTTDEDLVEITTTGKTALRYDTIEGKFIQNWQTPKMPGTCYQTTMTAQDGSKITAYFKLK